MFDTRVMSLYISLVDDDEGGVADTDTAHQAKDESAEEVQ